MARIDPLVPREWPFEMRAAMAALTPPNPKFSDPVSKDRPKALNLLGLLAHHHELAHAFLTFNGHVHAQTTLSKRQREMLVLRLCVVRGSAYEWAQHRIQAHDAGLTDRDIAQIAYGPDEPRWSPHDAALLRSVDELVADGKISDATWAALREEFDVQQVLDTIYTIGLYLILAWMVSSFEIDLDDDLKDR